MCRNAFVARAEYRVNATDSGERGAAGPGLAFVARHGSVAKIPAASALHDVAAHRRHVAQLTRRGEQQRLTDNRISGAHASVPRDVAHVCKRAEPQAAVWQLADTRETGVFSERIDVDEILRSLDVELHEIYESGTARDEFRRRVCARLNCIVERSRAMIIEVDHLPRTDCTAATIPGYAPQRQIFPLIASRTSLSFEPHGSLITAAADMI